MNFAFWRHFANLNAKLIRIARRRSATFDGNPLRGTGLVPSISFVSVFTVGMTTMSGNGDF